MKSLMKLVICAIIGIFAIAIANQSATSDPAVPTLDMTFAHNPIHVGQPCPSTLEAVLYFENYGTDPITVDWTSLGTPNDCVTDWLPQSGVGVGPISGNGGIDSVIITLYFPGECTGISEITFRGEIQGNTSDFDTEILRIFCNKKVPSLTTWGAAILVALLLISGLYVIRRRRVTA